MTTITLNLASRRVLLDKARRLATRARRARRIADLDIIREIGQQLDALDPESAEAPDVLRVASRMLHFRLQVLDWAGA